MGGDIFEISNSLVGCNLAQIIFSREEHRADTEMYMECACCMDLLQEWFFLSQWSSLGFLTMFFIL